MYHLIFNYQDMSCQKISVSASDVHGVKENRRAK